MEGDIIIRDSSPEGSGNSHDFCSIRMRLGKGISTEAQNISRRESHFLWEALGIIVDVTELRCEDLDVWRPISKF